MKISNISLYFQKEKILLKCHVLNKIAYAVKLCIVLILCAKKLLLKSEHFHSKSNCFQAPQTGISSTVCCKSDFTVISLYSSLDFPFQFKTLPTTSFPKSPPDCCEICTLFQCRTVCHLHCSGTVVRASWSMDKLCTFQRYFVSGFIAFTSPFSKVLDFIIMQGCFIPSCLCLESCKLSSETWQNKMIN